MDQGKIKPAYTLHIGGGVLSQYRFANGYGASVSKAPYTFLWQIGVTHGEKDELCENSPAFRGSIKTGLTPDQVQEWLAIIAAISPRNAVS